MSISGEGIISSELLVFARYSPLTTNKTMPTIQTDIRGKYVPFIMETSGYEDSYGPPVLDYPYYDPVELGLEKPLLKNPLKVEAALQLYFKGVPRYTGSGEETAMTAPMTLDLFSVLKTAHAVALLPSVLTLDEDNNYTAFCAVEANDGADWTVEPVDPRLLVTPTSGTGRGSVVVKELGVSPHPNPLPEGEGTEGWFFESVPLTVVSTADAIVYPDIEGERVVSDTAEVHIEQYVPEHNALIPKMDADGVGGVSVEYVQEEVAAEAWKAFDHSLTTSGIAGRWVPGMVVSPVGIDWQNLQNLPGIEVSFEVPHRIRSWSLQSVGSRPNEMVATTLVLQGRCLDGRWRVLDLVRMQEEYDYQTGSSMPELYTDGKNRLDRPVQTTALVDKVRVVAVGLNAGREGLILFPQVQVFAGVPVIPKMQSANLSDVQIESNGGYENYYDDYYGEVNRDSGLRVFDRQVSGTGLARIGSRQWYVNNNHFLLDDVAENGTIRQFGAFESKAWLSIMFKRARILGYLYSIDHLQNRTDHHANVSYAASLYFEGRQNADLAAAKGPSSQWDFIDLISLDRCIGHNAFGESTAVLIAEVGQTTINTYVDNLGLPKLDRTFLMNRTDYHFIRYNAATQKWYDDGWRLRPGSTSEFHNMDTDALLAQQSLLDDVAFDRGTALSLSWSALPDKISLVNQKDNRRVMYDLASDTWSEVPNNDAIYHVHDRTHYADLKDASGDPMLLEQLRCTVQSIMNTEKPSISGEPVAMPEMQLFGLPAETINSGAVATVTYLYAEDSLGNLHNILGKHQRLPFKSIYYYYSYSTTFRFYIGELQNVTAVANQKRLYLDVHNTYGTITTGNASLDNSNPYRDIAIAGDYRTLSAYFEVYIYSAENERIVLARGYTGE